MQACLMPAAAGASASGGACTAGRSQQLALRGFVRTRFQLQPRQLARPQATAAAAAADAGGLDGRARAFNGSGSLQAVASSAAAILSQHYLPAALLGGLIWGATYPSLGMAAAKLHVSAVATFGIFVVQGLQLRRREAEAALMARREIGFGLLSILLLTPLLGMAVAHLPLHPRPLAFGLGVVCVVPTALACGVAFVQQLGGNVSLALLLTVASNVLGIFTMPFFLPHIAAAAALGGGGGGMSAAAAQAAGGPPVLLAPLPLMLQLCQTILLPTLLGVCVRLAVPGAAAAIDAHRRQLAYVNAALLASVPWMQVSKAASQHLSLDPAALLATAAAALGLHIAFLLLNAAGCRVLQLGGPDPAAARGVRRALIISGSVKTLPVAVTVLTKLGPALGEGVVGVAMLPVVCYQLTQIMFESVLVSRWLSGDKAAGLS